MRLFTIRRLVVITGILLFSNLDLMSQDVVYLRTNLFGGYWGRNGNETALNRTFGKDGWTRRYFETADINELFDPKHTVIFVDGSNKGTCDLITFFNKYKTEFENYVTNGGALFINIAASECLANPIDLGFDGVISTFAGTIPNKRYGVPTDVTHDVFNGPFTPALADVYEGGNLAHNFLTGGSLSSILNTIEGNLILGEKLWGEGLVLFGGLTLEWFGENDFWAPQPHINNLYDNILAYLYAHSTGGPCTELPVVITQDIIVALDANGQATITASQVDNGSSSACGELSYAIDITDFSCLEVGANTVTLTVVDVNGESASAPSIVTIEDITPPIVITKNITVQLDELGAASISTDDVHESSSDACGIAIMELDISEFGCADIGDNPVLLSVTDNNGNITSELAMVTVENDSPMILSMDVPSGPFTINEELTVSAVYEDINLTSATWSWSDGTTSAGIITAGNITGSHTYIEPGIFTVTLLIEDVCGQIDQESFDYVIVVDPDGGFVTGGGYITSPKGAYLENEEVSGKAIFAFVAKYKKKKNLPHGATVFYLKESKIKFRSKSYDWLVVNKNVAMYQGTGKIRKDPRNYRFQVSVIDDGRGKKAEDTFRFQLWDIESGALVYDNQLGDETNENASQVIDKGAIVIHHYTDYEKGEDSDSEEDDSSDSEDKDSDSDEKDDGGDSPNKSSIRENAGSLANVGIELYPNPVANVLKIRIGSEITDFNKVLKISIISINGSRTVLSEHEDISRPKELAFNISALEKGIYYLLIEGENISKASKFIKY